MQGNESTVEDTGLIALLKTCAKNKDLHTGNAVHLHLLKSGLVRKNVFIASALINMYAKCGALSKAKEVLEEVAIRDVVCWSALIAGYAHGGHGREALNCLELMQQEGLSSNAGIFACALKACGNIGALEIGKRIHSEIIREGMLVGLVLGGALVDMYAKCGVLEKAKRILQAHPIRDVVLWNALITGYIEGGHYEEALCCFEWMQSEGLYPDVVTFTCILKVCSTIQALDKGEEIHVKIAKLGLLGGHIILANSLVDMYAKCGALAKAKEVLERLPIRDMVSWSALITGYVQVGDGWEALCCFEQMQSEGLSPDAATLACILEACGTIGALDRGVRVHLEIVYQGLLGGHVVLGGALIDMYAKCGALMKAEQVHEGLPCRSVVSWSAFIGGFAKVGQWEKVLDCFGCMQQEDLFPDAITYIFTLKACGNLRALEKGEQIYSRLIKQGLLADYDVLVCSALMEMYVKCGMHAKAKEVLMDLPIRDVVSWSVLIAGYAECGLGDEALDCYEQMQHDGLSLDVVTYTCILGACGNIGALNKGEKIHCEIARQGLLGGNDVIGNALVDMYSKCCAFTKAEALIERLHITDVVSWNALITGYSQERHGKEALSCYERMQCEGISPNVVTLACILKACGSIGAMQEGAKIHHDIVRQGMLGGSMLISGALVDMYSKCGGLEKAKEVFDGLPIQDVVLWNALITGYARGEHGDEALTCLELMLCEGFFPNEVTFLCVLTACTHSGLYSEACKFFKKMVRDYGITPSLKHHTCAVDFFGRAGLLDKAVEVIKKLSSFHHPPLWSALMFACQNGGNDKIGRWAFECALQLDTRPATYYVYMSNMFMAAV